MAQCVPQASAALKRKSRLIGLCGEHVPQSTSGLSWIQRGRSNLSPSSQPAHTLRGSNMPHAPIPLFPYEGEPSAAPHVSRFLTDCFLFHKLYRSSLTMRGNTPARPRTRLTRSQKNNATIGLVSPNSSIIPQIGLLTGDNDLVNNCTSLLGQKYSRCRTARAPTLGSKELPGFMQRFTESIHNQEGNVKRKET